MVPPLPAKLGGCNLHNQLCDLLNMWTLIEHSVGAFRAFDRACQLTGLSSAQLCRRLPPMMGKQNVLSCQTLSSWRRGRQRFRSELSWPLVISQA
jgi:hypothetical protein